MEGHNACVCVRDKTSPSGDMVSCDGSLLSLWTNKHIFPAITKIRHDISNNCCDVHLVVIFKSTAYRLGTSRIDVSICVSICVWFLTLSESQIREVW